jgi:hypothetical protein
MQASKPHPCRQPRPRGVCRSADTSASLQPTTHVAKHMLPCTTQLPEACYPIAWRTCAAALQRLPRVLLGLPAGAAGAAVQGLPGHLCLSPQLCQAVSAHCLAAGMSCLLRHRRVADHDCFTSDQQVKQCVAAIATYVIIKA